MEGLEKAQGMAKALDESNLYISVTTWKVTCIATRLWYEKKVNLYCIKSLRI